MTDAAYIALLVVEAIAIIGGTALYRILRNPRAGTASSLSLVHRPGEIPLYLQLASFSSDGLERRHRVGLMNTGASTLSDVQVILEEGLPLLPGVMWPERPLHIMAMPRDRGGRVSLCPVPDVPAAYVEVFQEVRFRDCDHSLIRVVYDSTILDLQNRFVDRDLLAVTVRVQGNFPPKRIRLVATRDDDGWYRVQESQVPVPEYSGVPDRIYQVGVTPSGSRVRLQSISTADDSKTERHGDGHGAPEVPLTDK